MSVRDCIKDIESYIREASDDTTRSRNYQEIRDRIDRFCACPSSIDSDQYEQFTSEDLNNTELFFEHWKSLMGIFFDTVIGFQGCFPSNKYISSENGKPLEFEELESLLQEPGPVKKCISMPFHNHLSEIRHLCQTHTYLTDSSSADSRSDKASQRWTILSHSVRIADVYHRFNIWKIAAKNTSVLLKWDDLALQKFLNTSIFTEWDPEEMRVIHSDFQDLQDNLCFKLAQKRGLVPSSFYITGIAQWGDNPIGGGGFADVWLGYYDLSNIAFCHYPTLALKVLKHFDLKGGQHSNVLKALCREAVLWKRANHPNVLKFIGICQLDGRDETNIALVSPRMENGNLLSYAEKNEKNEDVNRPALLAQIAHGLIYLHSVDIIHGDLKCSNVLVDDQGIAQLADFGLSSVGNIGESINGSLSNSAASGNPRWLAPELMFPETFNGSGRTNFESDVYAFGMTALELFTGKAPFLGLLPVVAVPLEVAIHGYRPPHPGRDAVRRGLTRGTWELIEKCWHQDPFSRPKTRGETGSDLLDFAISSGSILHVRCSLPHIGVDHDDAIILGRGRKMFSATKGWFKNVISLRIDSARELHFEALKPRNENYWQRIHRSTCKYSAYRGSGVTCRLLRNKFDSIFDFRHEYLCFRNCNPELRNPNVAPLIGHCEIRLMSKRGLIFDLDPRATLVLDYISETSTIKRLGILEGITNGLSYLHRLNIVHGDLRSANIVVEKGIARLVDYCIPNCYRHETECMEHKVFVAPEILQLPCGVEEQPTKESDMYSLAMTFYEILTEELPFSDTRLSEQELLNKIVDEDLRPQHPGIIAEERGLSTFLWTLMSRCWNADVNERPTADLVLEDIRFLNVIEGQRGTIPRSFNATNE